MYRNNFEGACGDRVRRQRSFLNVMHSPFYSLSLLVLHPHSHSHPPNKHPRKFIQEMERICHLETEIQYK